MVTHSSTPFLLVDGYNIIGAWPSLQKTRDGQGLEPARRQLVEMLVNYSAHQGYLTQIIFDAYSQRQSSGLEQPTPHLSIHFTDWMQTADTYIEKFCANWSRQPLPTAKRVIVATSDQAQRLTIQGYGAEWISAHRLAVEVSATAQMVKQKQNASPTSRRRLLFNCLDATGQQRLTEFQKNFGRR